MKIIIPLVVAGTILVGTAALGVKTMTHNAYAEGYTLGIEIANQNFFTGMQQLSESCEPLTLVDSSNLETIAEFTPTCN